jgi:hypothetical protein
MNEEDRAESPEEHTKNYMKREDESNFLFG